MEGKGWKEREGGEGQKKVEEKGRRKRGGAGGKRGEVRKKRIGRDGKEWR